MTIAEYFTPYSAPAATAMKRYENLLHYGDLRNVVSIGSKAAYDARVMVKSGVPYYRMYDSDKVLTLGMTHHFITELRRQLSGTIDTPSMFSVEEEALYTKYLKWVDGEVLTGEDLLAATTVDKWITDEVMGVTHPIITRGYPVDHPWYKV